MALIIKNREVVEDDWTVISADAEGRFPLPEALPPGKILVPLALWKTAHAALTSTRQKSELGIWLAPNDEPEEAAPAFDAVTILAVQFLVFRDGRGISIARLLRERHGWKGEIRAIGDVLRDQIGYMSRCGIDAFAVRADKDIYDALKAFDELSVHYQGAYDDPRPLFRRVHREPTSSGNAREARAKAAADATHKHAGAGREDATR